jgi:hypothetical protein
MAYDVTTEWEDIHVKLGNYLPTKEKRNYNKEEQDFIEKNLEFLTKKIDENHSKRDDDTINEEDIFNDDCFMNDYKRKIIQENKNKILNNFKMDSLNSKDDYYSTLNTIKDKDELEKKILNYNHQNNTSNINSDREYQKENENHLKSIYEKSLKNKLIALYLFKPTINRCHDIYNLVQDSIENLNKKHNKLESDNYHFSNNTSSDIIVLFKMISTNCVSNYEDNDVPGLLFYFNGTIVHKYIKISNDLFSVRENSESKFYEEINKLIISSKKYIDNTTTKKLNDEKVKINKIYNKNMKNNNNIYDTIDSENDSNKEKKILFLKEKKIEIIHGIN